MFQERLKEVQRIFPVSFKEISQRSYGNLCGQRSNFSAGNLERFRIFKEYVEFMSLLRKNCEKSNNKIKIHN